MYVAISISFVLIFLIYQFPVGLRLIAKMIHRESTLPVDNLPLDQPVTLYRNEYDVPFIHAQTDHDLAFTIGLMQAHHRLPQIELSKMISKGELSLIFGRKANDIDHTLRILQFGKVTKEIIDALPIESRTWLDDYLQGLNYYIEHVDSLPWDLKLMNIRPKPWTLEDLITMFRMACADVNWVYLAGFIRDMTNPEWRKVWKIFMQFNQGSVPSNIEAMPEMQDIIQSFTKSGSNSLVIGKEKTKTGSAMIVSDPHISVFLPNLWYMCGMKSPTYHAVGLMIAGTPILSLGRNKSIAWGATNMYSISSYIYKLTGEEKFETKKETIKTRFGKATEVEIRNSQYGPIISDSSFFESEKPYAMYWMGHKVSDEVTTFLKITRATSWDEFHTAFHTYSVLGLNYLYADFEGNVGYVPAFTQPLNSSDHKKIFYTPNEFLSDVIPQSKLDRIYNPNQGYLGSCNNRPAVVDRDWGWFYAPNDRILRQAVVMESLSQVKLDDLKVLQLDVRSISALQWIRWIMKETNSTVCETNLVKKLASWNGDYHRDQIEPLILELLVFELSERVLAPEFQQKQSVQKLQKSTFMKEWIEIKLMEKTIDERSKVILDVLESIRPKVAKYKNWGSFHKMKVQYLFGYLPWIGKAFQQGTYPVSGGSDTLYKRAFAMNGKDTYVTYGSNARHISDLSDVDANYFLIYGGQNGYPFHSKNDDQIELWEKGEYIQMPLNLETVQKLYQNVTVLRPKTMD